MAELTLAHLKMLLHYDPETGIFRWKVGGRGRLAGEIAGYHDKRGYITIRVDYKLFYAHRLAWFFMTGNMPSLIDHHNCIKSDNRWINLRKATKSQNAANSFKLHKGVYWHKSAKRWSSSIKLNYQTHYLGLFDTPEAAQAAYAAKAREFFGEFARSI
jgi:HNH endonuclease